MPFSHYFTQVNNHLFYLQYTGTSYAAARYGSATPVPPSIISRGAGWVV